MFIYIFYVNIHPPLVWDEAVASTLVADVQLYHLNQCTENGFY